MVEVFELPGLDNDAIDIGLFSSSNEVTKTIDHAPLVCDARVL